MYPYDIHHLTAQDYINFSQIMKPFLRPRQNGIDTLELWIQGYSNYLRSVGEHHISMHGLYSDCPLKELESAVKWEIDHNLPVPYLNLKHANPDLAAYVWHWFWLAGYAQYEDTFLVKLVTYGSFRWFSLEELWNSGYKTQRRCHPPWTYRKKEGSVSHAVYHQMAVYVILPWGGGFCLCLVILIYMFRNALPAAGHCS